MTHTSTTKTPQNAESAPWLSRWYRLNKQIKDLGWREIIVGGLDLKSIKTVIPPFLVIPFWSSEFNRSIVTIIVQNFIIKRPTVFRNKEANCFCEYTTYHRSRHLRGGDKPKWWVKCDCVLIAPRLDSSSCMWIWQEMIIEIACACMGSIARYLSLDAGYNAKSLLVMVPSYLDLFVNV